MLLGGVRSDHLHGSLIAFGQSFTLLLHIQWSSSRPFMMSLSRNKLLAAMNNLQTRSPISGLASMVLLFVSVLLLVWGTRQSQPKEWEERLPSIMTITIVCDLVSTLLFATLFVTIFECRTSFCHFYGADYKSHFLSLSSSQSLVAWLSTLATVLTLTSIFWIWP